MSATDNLGQQFGPPAGPHLKYDAESWPVQHAREYGHVKREQKLGQMDIVKQHLAASKAAREAGDLGRAARAQHSAAVTRKNTARLFQ